ncbi:MULTISPECIES: hypothetical protein [unclassified Rhodococcus (in: high G+C Gram-positive bacteria)]|uniref:hypothetical protein n=1 Tax=unclassified Rhodococcus (in: high G+C Gram-positive bacteria) TaxID=192944 RepID=UPI0033932A22
MTSAKAGSALWTFTGVMFLVYPVFRPYSSEVGLEGAEAFGETGWVIAHVCAMLGFITIALALRNLEYVVGATAANSMARTAVVLTWIGVGLTLAYYGAEAFALNAVGTQALSDSDPKIMDLTDPIRNGAIQISMFVVGLLLILVGGICTAIAVRRSGVLPSWSGLPLAVGLASFLPQFFASPALRIAHGALMFGGCLVLAWALWYTQVDRVRTDLTPSVS